MNRKLLIPISLLLIVSLFVGCAFTVNVNTDFTVPLPSLPETTEVNLSDAAVRLQNGGNRDYLDNVPVDMLPFEVIPYTRPDTASLCERFNTLTAQVEAGATAEEILQDYYSVYDDYYSFYTMDSLANIRYSLDTTDSYYKAEYDYCEAQTPEVEEKLEAFYKACAVSDEKAELEAQYFGEGFLDDYLDFSLYTNEEYLSLSQQEEAILSEYRAALEQTEITYNNKTGDYQEMMENATTAEDYYGIYKEYYDTYNPILCEYYIQLIKVRQQIASVLGYDSYAAYCYDAEYGRDYSHEQGEAYAQSIRTQLVPLYKTLLQSGNLDFLSSSPATQREVMAAMDGAVKRMGGQIEEAYTFMKAYSLYDLTQSDDKMDVSFTTYLYSYEAPFLTVDTDGTMSDLTTFAHEFGHFTDSYVNYQSNEDLETAETFSQSMEYLVTYELDGLLDADEIQMLRKLKLSDTLSTFVSQAAFADFEDRVYALDEGKLTAAHINQIYRQVCKDYGFYEADYDFFYSQAWVEVTHFFEAPYYVISYCVSADTSLQICQLADTSVQAALEQYNTLLGRQAGDGVQAVTEAAGLENPFNDGRMEEITEFLRTELKLE